MQQQQRRRLDDRCEKEVVVVLFSLESSQCFKRLPFLSLSFLLVEKGLFQKTTKGARWNLGPSSSLRRHTGETRATTFNKRKESRTNERDSLAPQLINKPTPKKKKKYTQERDGTEERECLKRLVYQGETTLHLLVLHTLFQIHFFLFQKKKKKINAFFVRQR